MYKALTLVFILAAFSAPSASLRVFCDFRLGTWTFGSNVYTCYATVLDNLNINVLEIANPGGHLPGMSNDLVLGLYFRNQFVNHMPLNIGWRFRNLRGFECDNCNITSLRSSQLERLTNLLHFAIPRNRVRSIPGNYFRFARKIQWLYLHNNILSNTGLNIFKNLRDLRGLYLANNGCISDNAVMDRRQLFLIMHGLVRRCAPDIDDFIRDTEGSECDFPDDTSNESPPKSSESKSKKTKEKMDDEPWQFWEI